MIMFMIQLTDDVWCVHVVGELVLVVVVVELVQGALVAGLQDVVEHLQAPEVATQPMDPQSLLVTQDRTAHVGLTWGWEICR